MSVILLILFLLCPIPPTTTTFLAAPGPRWREARGADKIALAVDLSFPAATVSWLFVGGCVGPGKVLFVCFVWFSLVFFGFV